MTSAEKIVEQAEKGKYIGIPYSRLDCQGLIKKIRLDAGCPRSARGSNDMWRNWVTDRQTSDTAPQPGELVFTIKRDGGEVSRGYHDDMGNASHVGLVLNGGKVIHSTTGGVQLSNISQTKRWTHHAKMNDLSYGDNEAHSSSQLAQQLRAKLREMEELVNEID